MATRQLPPVTPLIDIRNADFGRAYEQGLGWSLFGDRDTPGLLDDMYLVDNLKILAAHDCFNGTHDDELAHIGFFVGMLHGSILVPETGDPRPDVTALVTFTNKECKRGYRAGREWFFYDAEPHEKRRTDSDFIERLRDSITEMLSFGDDDTTWNYTIGCFLGELSGLLFPQTQPLPMPALQDV